MTVSFFFFNDTATTEIYTLSLHDALPIYGLRTTTRLCGIGSPPDSAQLAPWWHSRETEPVLNPQPWRQIWRPWADRKSTRLNSSHANISYAVFCLKKKKNYNHYYTFI